MLKFQVKKMYNSIESNKKKIALNEELIKNKKKRKKEFQAYNVYRSGIQTDLYDRIQDIEGIKKQLKESETKPEPIPESRIVPFLEEEKDEEDDLEEAYRELDIFNPNPLGKVSPTSRFFTHIDPHSKKISMWMNENKNIPITRFNPLVKYFVINGKRFDFNKEIIDLMRGDRLSNHNEDDLREYAKILHEAGAFSGKGRYKEVLDKLKEKTGEGVTFLSDDPVELFDRLKILIPARKEGHNSTGNEIHAILKRLLEKNLITSQQYKNFSTA